MNLIEKMAKESVPDRWNGHCNCEEDFQEGFEAGFRKAREMAAEKMNHFMVAYGWEGRLMTTNEVIHSEKHEMPLGKALIDQLGEEEV